MNDAPDAMSLEAPTEESPPAAATSAWSCSLDRRWITAGVLLDLLVFGAAASR